MPIVSATILSEGKKLDAGFRLLSIDVRREVNRIPSAELMLADGDAAGQRFELSDADWFDPGKTIEIQLGYEESRSNAKTVFKGLVVRHALEAGSSDSRLCVELRDATFGLTGTRKSEVYADQSDDRIIKKLLSDAGLAAGSIPSTQPTHAELVRYYCTDWDFILLRAEANNLLVGVTDGKLSLYEIAVAGSARHTFTFGVSPLYRFELEADASEQYGGITSVAWDSKTQKMTQESKAAELSLPQGNLEGGAIADKLGRKTYTLNSAVDLDPKEIKAWADGRLGRARLSLYRGVLSVAGLPDIELLDDIELAKFGKRFDGKTIVTGIRHEVNPDGWITHLQIGLSARPFAHLPDVTASSAGGLLPAVRGLQIGKVAEFKADPDNKFRLRVILPGIDPQAGAVWARLASPDAGKERGWVFRPEPGDEVIVGFLNEDPRQAVVLGALFNPVNVLPPGLDTLDTDNFHKGIVSRSGVKILVNDEDRTLTLVTSENQHVRLDEKNKTVEILDVNNNKITLDDQGIKVESAKKISIEAQGDLELKGSNIKIEASANVAIKGAQVDVK